MPTTSFPQYRQQSFPIPTAITEHDQPLESALTNAYQRLTHDQLVLFLSIRRLPTTGQAHVELARRLALYDIEKFAPSTTSLPINPALSSAPTSPPERRRACSLEGQPSRSTLTLPVEICAVILDHLGDWELAKSVGIPTSLPCPVEWDRSTDMDKAVLTGRVWKVSALKSARLSTAGANVVIRFAFFDILRFFLTRDRDTFNRKFGLNGEGIPTKASRFGRTDVLDWWKQNKDIPNVYDSDAIDGACKNGHINVLDWWRHSDLPLKYTDASLENASAKAHVAVLDWWKCSGLPLKIGRVIEMGSKSGDIAVLEWWARSQVDLKYDSVPLYNASCAGRVEILQWWLESGLQMMFDKDALIGATRHNRPEVLEWWDRSKLPIQYRICDIEEAVEDAVRPGHEARDWWSRKGVNFSTDDMEWMKWQTLN